MANFDSMMDEVEKQNAQDKAHSQENPANKVTYMQQTQKRTINLSDYVSGEELEDDSEDEKPAEEEEFNVSQIPVNYSEDTDYSDDTDEEDNSDVAAEQKPVETIAEELSQEVVFVVFPDQTSAEDYPNGLNFVNPFSKKGGALRVAQQLLHPKLANLASKQIMLLGNKNQIEESIQKLYGKINDGVGQQLMEQTSIAQLSEEDQQIAIENFPIESALFVEGGNVVLTYMAGFPNFRNDADTIIKNLGFWLKSLDTTGYKFHLIFAFDVEDLLDPQINLNISTMLNSESFNAQLTTAKNNSFQLPADMLTILNDSYAAFVKISL